MLPVLNVEDINKYLNVVGAKYKRVTQCYGTIYELAGFTDKLKPFLIKFLDKTTMLVCHGANRYRFEFTEHNYPLR
jgi:hypothetical protein